MQKGTIIRQKEENDGKPEEPSEIDQVTSILHKGDELLGNEEVRLKKCVKAFEAEEAFMTNFLQSEDSMVGLNINGEVVTVSLRVLRCFPDSVLAIAFDCQRWTVLEEELDDSGNQIMEHDPYCFRRVSRIRSLGTSVC